MFIKSSGRAADFLADLHACFSRKTVDYSTDSEHSPKSRASSHSNFARTSSRMAEINMLWVDISPIYRISPFFRFSRATVHSPWINDLREGLCRIFNARHQLITVFDFDDQRHEGKLEKAILEAVFNGLLLSILSDILIHLYAFKLPNIVINLKKNINRQQN